MANSLRAEWWQRLGEHPRFDLVIIGGGITGAGLLREATRAGLKALLVEKKDFAWGTSSRSSKLVHGGMRYLKQGAFKLTKESVLERERMLTESQDLVQPLPFLVPNYKGQKPGAMTFKAGISMYNMIAGTPGRISYSVEEAQLMAPHLSTDQLQGCQRYMDARADDVRMVLRLIFEACDQGALALNRVTASKPEKDGKLWHLTLTNGDGEVRQVQAPVLVNATGVWANKLRGIPGLNLRPLRGSHLVFPAWRLPAPQAVVVVNPSDHRPMYVLPWEGATVFGTTDLDHRADLDEEPGISQEEATYLMNAVQLRFPSLNLTRDDVVSCFAGVRPVISTGKADPSKESRDHAIWDEDGLLSITGGKLTTFRVMAVELLGKAAAYLPSFVPKETESVYDDTPPQWPKGPLADPLKARLWSRYGGKAGDIAAAVPKEDLTFVPGTETLWAEIRYGARSEMVNGLDDLLLRRVRLGLLLPHGAKEILARVEKICAEELGWDEGRWQQEQKDYLDLVARCYSLPRE